MTPADTQGVVRCMVSEYMAHMPTHTDTHKGRVQLVSYITSCTKMIKLKKTQKESQMVSFSGRWTH